MAKAVCGRFAPTPSGRMHLGNVFCALLAWLSAKKQGGTITLRIEDLDKPRCPAGSDMLLEDDLHWLGLEWDTGGSAGGKDAPYYQSRRFDIYAAYFAQLQKLGLTYPCFCNRAELHAAQAPHLSDGRILYAGTCRHLTAEQTAAKARTKDPAQRLRPAQFHTAAALSVPAAGLYPTGFYSCTTADGCRWQTSFQTRP